MKKIQILFKIPNYYLSSVFLILQNYHRINIMAQQKPTNNHNKNNNNHSMCNYILRIFYCFRLLDFGSNSFLTTNSTRCGCLLVNHFVSIQLKNAVIFKTINLFNLVYLVPRTFIF